MSKRVQIGFRILLLLLAIGSFAGFAESAEKKVNTNEGEKGAVDRNMAYLTVSGELARLAADSKDAILMLAAARLEAMAATEEASRDKTSEGGTTEAGAPKPEKADLYALAEQFAGTNEALHLLIKDSKASGRRRGAVGGPKLSYDRVGASSADSFRVRFRGREYAEVSVSGDGDTDLDLYVYDEYGNLVCRDTDRTDQTYCGWTPAWTGTFRIKIENLGSVYNRYRITTN